MSVLTVKGNIASDVKSTVVGDKTVLNFSVANNDYSKKEGSEFIPVPVFYDVSFWVKSPDYWLNKLHKGNFFVGDCTGINLNIWQDNEGNPRGSIRVTVMGNPDVREKVQQSNSGYPG